MNVICRLDDFSVMGDILFKLGYSLTDPQDAGRGRIAVKDDLEVKYNPDRQLISISGRNPDRVLKAFTALLRAIEQDDGNTLRPFFHETILYASAEGTKNPLETFARVSRVSTKLKKMFGSDVSLYGLRFSPSKKTVDSTDWFEFRIEPHLFRPDKAYSIVYVYRSKDLSKVVEVNSKLGETIKNVISELEVSSPVSGG
jgi:hypothetical protein